ncbi:MAG: glutamate racemase [Ginsengibacter sp.]
MKKYNPIGVFDSGYGGLTVLKEMLAQLPQYDYLYLGDNARAPYGNRSFETVYQYTKECVDWFFAQGCSLVILACNTASAKALRSIQQCHLPKKNRDKRVLGVIRPTTEIIGQLSATQHIGVLATNGTVQSSSYPIEIEKFYPGSKVYQQACPMWVPLVENDEYTSEGADFFIEKDIKKLMTQSAEIDTILLACTHYPLLIDKIKNALPNNIKVVSQAQIVALSLTDYLQRHPDIESDLTKNGDITLCTTDSVVDFDRHSQIFFDKNLLSRHVDVLHPKKLMYPQ